MINSAKLFYLEKVHGSKAENTVFLTNFMGEFSGFSLLRDYDFSAKNPLF